MGTQTRGRPFLQIPGPTNIPDRVLRAMDRAIIDHRGPEFAALVRGLLPDVRRVFGAADAHPAIFPSSGTGAWEASLVNTLAPGDRVLAFDHGHFATLFAAAARNLGLQVDLLPSDWRRPIPAEDVKRALRDGRHRAVLVVQTRPRPASATTSPRCGRPWMRPAAPRCSSSTR